MMFLLSIPILGHYLHHLELNWRNREKKLYQDREKERQDYLGQIFKAQEEERKRISREIHDDSIQRLSVIAGNARRLIREERPENQPVLKGRVESIQNMIVDVSQDLRRITLDLRPAVLDDMGLVPAIRWLVDNFKQETGLNVLLEINGPVRTLSGKASINLFRIVQEALTNIKRHSGATEVLITVNFTRQSIQINIQDNGKGFVPPRGNRRLTSRGKLGITGMQQRAQLIHGAITYQSEIGKGTTISIEAAI
jgi:signal transduction histidine kinase